MRTHRAVLGAALLASIAMLAPAEPTPRDDDAARARTAVQQRRFVPLASILDWIEARYHGHAIEIELELEDGGDGEPPTYEVEWLAPSGQVVEFEFDATSGELLEVEGRDLDAVRK